MNAPGVDLDGRTREALELDELLEWVAGFAATAAGARRVRALRPLADDAAVGRELDAVEQARAHLADHGRLVGAPLPDVRESLAALGVAERSLDPKSLLGLAVVAGAAGELGARLSGLPDDTMPRLVELGRTLPDLRSEAAPVLACVDGDGRVADEASPELRAIRTARVRTADRLRRILERHIKGPGADDVIQDDFITRRSGRYVIPVRADAPRRVRGIIHGTSSSGATQFIEPLESVELNNELVKLAEQERDELERLARSWTEAFRLRRDELGCAVEGLAEADALQARALFACEIEAVRPTVGGEAGFELDRARHPLLDRRLREQGGGCVPFDLRLDAADRVLVLSGPNTGGKTVALKTIGLVVLMAQSGIPVPAGRVRIPLYRQVRADIGDHQSIQADLSTYSAHVRSVVEFLRDASPPALFLFDEIGTGTEPTEGAALARSILEALRAPGMTAVATTHHGAVKTWAFDTEGVASAALEFDTEALRPTFRVLAGVAGTSAGLDIAERLGLDPEIVDRARSSLDPAARRAERYMERLRELVSGLEGERGELQRRQAELDELRARAEARAHEKERRLREKATSELQAVLRRFRARARAELAGVADKRERRRVGREMDRAERRLRTEGQTLETELAGPAPAAGPPEGWVEPRELLEGMRVYVRSLAKEGRVSRIRGREAEVLLGHMVFTVERSDLLAAATPTEDEPTAARVDTPDIPEVPSELMLLGKTVDEALEAVDRFLDAASRSALAEVRVIHGHGTGRLRTAVREFLRSHLLVAEQRPGNRYEGGDGATVVKLK